MNIRDAYTQWSETYDHDRNLTRDLDADVTRQTLEKRRYRSIVELGCGTGKNTTFLAQVGARVLALDFSEGMMAQAEKKVRESHVSFVVADLTQPWPCADSFADLIVCNLVLEHLQNLPFIFAEASRTLVAGGQFFVCELHPFKQYLGVKANFQRDSETTLIPAFVHHLSDFTQAADNHGFALQHLREWWHEEDQGKPPRLVSFLFAKRV
jgi:ubiquinone/menaquinone biosynthesis C-methylase UbiE